jgi:hypothetical protein
MPIIIAISLLALVATCILKSSRAFDASHLIEPRTEPLTIGIQIICGDCSGEGERPIKTYLDRHGNCTQCGGHSYILASSRIVYAQQLILERLANAEVTGNRERPFDGSPGMQTYAARKVRA